MSDANGIVVLTQIQPISVFFNLPQQELTRVNKAFASGPSKSRCCARTLTL